MHHIIIIAGCWLVALLMSVTLTVVLQVGPVGSFITGLVAGLIGVHVGIRLAWRVGR